MWCFSLTSVTIPNSVTYIGSSAFNGCSGLTSITIPDSVTWIDNGAFWFCSGLTSITIPKSVMSIGSVYCAFRGCSGLTKIMVDENNLIYDSRNNCNAIIDTSNDRLIQGCMTTVIPDSVTSIGDNAFDNCVDLTSIAIPDSVTNIGYGAFNYCDNLSQVYYFGKDLKNITIGDSNEALLNANITYLKSGDTDFNKSVDIKDATLAQRYIAELETGNTENNLCADVNWDGVVDVKDVTLIQMYLAGLVEAL